MPTRRSMKARRLNATRRLGIESLEAERSPKAWYSTCTRCYYRMSTHIIMAITRLSWSGEARRLSVEPEGRVESPELNDHEGSARMIIEQISQHILVQKLDYAVTIIHHIGTIQYTGTMHMSIVYMYTPTLVQTQQSVTITCSRYNYHSTDTHT